MSFEKPRISKVPKEPKMSKKQKATLYVHVPPELHKRARMRALNDGVNLAAIVEAALAQYLDAPPVQEATT